jgi:lysophospholipase L1-like esterase
MTQPLPARGATDWYAWPEFIHDEVTERLSDTALRAAYASSDRAMFRAGRSWLFVGTSITNGANASNVVYSYPYQAPAMAGTWRAAGVGEGSIAAGTPGSTVAGNLGRLPDLLDAHGPAGVFLEVGPNDASDANATPLASFQDTVAQMVTLVKASGAACVIATPSPRAATASAGEKLRLAQQAAWLRLWAPEHAVEVADFQAALVDPSTGSLAAAYDGDGTHPNTHGHMVLGQVAAAAMLRAAGTGPASPTIAAGVPGGLLANPLLVPNGTVPNGSIKPFPEAGTAPTLSMETADSTGRRPGGAWAVETLVAAADSLYTRQFVVGSGWAVGDTLAVTGYVEITDNAGRWMADVAAGTASARVFVRNQNIANIPGGVPWERTPGRLVAPNTYAIGPAWDVFTVPAGVTSMTYNYVLQLPTGGSVVARWATLDLINLTALGLA